MYTEKYLASIYPLIIFLHPKMSNKLKQNILKNLLNRTLLTYTIFVT